jgi:phage gp36-like protein
VSAYIEAQDIIDTYGQLQFNRISSPKADGVSDPKVVQRGIDSASSIIDMYLGGRFTLPLAVVPPVLVELAVDIAIYKMPLGPTTRTPEMRLRYDDALKMLAQIAAGTLSLGLSTEDLTANGDADTQKSAMGRSIRTYRI